MMKRIEKIRLQNIGVFEDVSIEFPKAKPSDKAEVHILTGMNGSGKSTLLEGLVSLFIFGTDNPLHRKVGEKYELEICFDSNRYDWGIEVPPYYGGIGGSSASVEEENEKAITENLKCIVNANSMEAFNSEQIKKQNYLTLCSPTQVTVLSSQRQITKQKKQIHFMKP